MMLMKYTLKLRRRRHRRRHRRRRCDHYHHDRVLYRETQ